MSTPPEMRDRAADLGSALKITGHFAALGAGALKASYDLVGGNPGLEFLLWSLGGTAIPKVLGAGLDPDTFRNRIGEEETREPLSTPRRIALSPVTGSISGAIEFGIGYGIVYGGAKAASAAKDMLDLMYF